MATPLIVLEYLRVLLSAPVVLGLIAAVCLYLFKAQLRSLLTRVALIKWGSAELSVPQPPSDAPLVTGSQSTTVAIETDHSVLPIPAGTQLPAGVEQQLLQAFNAERARAHLWEYRYLNHFLVHNTQNVLDWLASLANPPTFTMYDALWQNAILGAAERRTIVNVLENHNLIEFQGELLTVTPKGREYTQWRGPRHQPQIPGDVS